METAQTASPAFPRLFLPCNLVAMSASLYERCVEAADVVRAHAPGRAPVVGLILGSGLGGVADAISERVEIPYGQIPYFVKSTVVGHEGSFLIGSCGGVCVAAMKGRFHFYEGYSLEDVTLPIRVFSVLGIRSLVVTNAAGGASPQLEPGTLMLITDHINMLGDNPLRGPNDERFGPRFPDMTTAYTPAYIEAAHHAARELGLKLAEGVYLALRGPSYETPAEVRMMAKLGGDALGMSTVPEVIVARHCGMKVLAISCITNTAAGLTWSEINHAEVIEVGERSGRDLSRLIIRVIPRLASIDLGGID